MNIYNILFINFIFLKIIFFYKKSKDVTKQNSDI